MERKSNAEIKIKCFYAEDDVDIGQVLEKEILYYIEKEISDMRDEKTLFSDN